MIFGIYSLKAFVFNVFNLSVGDIICVSIDMHFCFH